MRADPSPGLLSGLMAGHIACILKMQVEIHGYDSFDHVNLLHSLAVAVVNVVNALDECISYIPCIYTCILFLFLLSF